MSTIGANKWADAIAWTALFLFLVWLLALCCGCEVLHPYGSGEVQETILEPSNNKGPDLWNKYPTGWKHE